MKKILCLLLCFSIFWTGCAGHEPNPINCYMPGDEKKSCNILLAEMSQIQSEISVKQKKHEEKHMLNIIELITGFIIIIPWFFMDLKGAEKAEIEALERRYDKLMLLAVEKDCSLSNISAE